MAAVRFLTLNPGHFHAALVQKEMYAEVEPRVHVYAPLDADLIAHLNRIAAFNARAENPTRWELEVHAGGNSLQRMLDDRAGNVLVLAGRNRSKIAAIEAAIAAGVNVLADKPWIIAPQDLPRIEAVLNQAEARGLVAYDIMTERFEITSILQRELVNDAEVFGTLVADSPDAPSVVMESVHYIKKTVAGMPLKRPAWFFDIGTQGEGLSDVGTHLVDLVPWMLYPEQPIDYRSDIALCTATRWPTFLSRDQFTQVTGEGSFPNYPADHIADDRLAFFCNTRITYALRGRHVLFNIIWDYEAAPGSGDSHFARFPGSNATVEIRQGKEEKFIPELYVLPATPSARKALQRKVAALLNRYPGLQLDDRGQEVRLVIPGGYRTGHEAHFGEVTKQFLRFLSKEQSLPDWEKPNMLAKYFVTTAGVELSRISAR